MNSQLKTRITLSLFMLLAGTNALACDQYLAKELASVLKYGDVVDSSIQVCLDRAESTNVEAEVTKNAGLFGDITANSPLWSDARAVYIKFLKSDCYSFDKDKAIAAVIREYAAGLTDSEAQAVLAFYQTEAGRKFRDAGIKANNAANKEASDPLTAQRAFDLYTRELDELIQKHKEWEKTKMVQKQGSENN